VLGVKITHAIDDRGQTRVQPAAFVAGTNSASAAEELLLIPEGESGSPLEQPRHVPVRLSRGNEPAHHLKEVRGVLTAMVRSPAEELASIDLPPKQLNQTIPGRKGQDVTVKSFEENGETLRVFAQVGWPQPEVSPIGLGRAVRVNRGFRRGQAAPAAEEGEPTPCLLDKNGKRPQTAVGFLLGREIRSDRIVATYLLTFQREEGVNEPVKLQVTGRRSVLIEVPFVFKDVPLAE
jgi:hypothetical protein